MGFHVTIKFNRLYFVKFFIRATSDITSFRIKFLHGHPIGELLESLAVEGDGDASIGIKGELHAVLNLRFSPVLHRCVRVVFVPTI